MSFGRFGQTVVEYNGIHITRCVTEQWDQVPVYDASGVELLHHKITVTVSGYITGDDRTSGSGDYPLQPDSFRVGGAPGIDDYDATDEFVYIRSKLLKPRHRLTMCTGAENTDQRQAPDADSGGAYLLDVLPYPTGTLAATEWPLASPSVRNAPTGNDFPGDRSGYDLNNGPKPLGCSITRIIGNTVLFVRFTFEVCKIECDSGDGQAPNVTQGVLSNRWSMSDSIDSNRMTVRTITGKLRVTTPHIEANAFRGWVVPTLQDGMRRESMQFRVTEDGLNLDYTITDREIAYSVPQPATSWQYKYTESTLTATTTMSHVMVHLKGDRNTDKRELIKTAVAIANARTNFLVDPPPADFVLNDVTCVDEYSDSDNSITLSVQIQRAKTANELAGLGVTNLGVPIEAADFATMVMGVPTGIQPLGVDYDRNKSTTFLTPIAGTPGYIRVETRGALPVINAFASYLRSTCGDDRKIEESVAAGNINYYAENSPDYDLTVVITPATLPTTATGQSASGYLNDTMVTSSPYKTEREFPYTNWQCESVIKQDRLRVQLPIATSVNYTTPSPSDPYQPPSSTVATLAMGVVTRIIRFTGTRIGRPLQMPAGADTIPIGPQLASPAPEPPNAILLSSSFRPKAPSRTVDGQLIYSADGEFVYALPSNVVDLAGEMISLFLGVNPWENTSTAKYSTNQVMTNQTVSGTPVTP
jgi:hypothetical protein